MHEENYLQHYGVLGMKWGVRRKVLTPTGNVKKDGKTFAKLNKKLHTLTLRTLYKTKHHDRLEAERIITKATYDKFLNEAKVQRGKDYVNEMIRINNTRNRYAQLYDIK